MNRDQVVDLAERVGVVCLGYLVLVCLLRGATVAELRLITLADRHIITDYLKALELRGLLIAVQHSRSVKWFPSQPALELLGVSIGENPTIGPTTTTALLSSPDLEAAVAERPVDGENPTIKPELAQAFKAAGIGSNAWARLAELDYITPEYVRAHDAQRRREGKSVGLLITRLRSGDAVPEESPEIDFGQRQAAEWAELLARRNQDNHNQEAI